MLAGNAPEGILENQDYLVLIEQIKFFAGKLSDIDIKEQNNFPLWLEDNFDEKLSWFEKNLLPYRDIEKHDVQELHRAITKRALVQDEQRQVDAPNMRKQDNFTKAASKNASPFLFASKAEANMTGRA